MFLRRKVMSGIEGIRGLSSANSPAIHKLGDMRGKLEPAKLAEKMQGKLDEQLSSAGVSEETRESLLADLSAEIEGQMSSGSIRDPKAIKETVSGIFEKHGLNAEDFMRKSFPMTGGMGRTIGSGGAGGGQFESLLSLFESLHAESDGETNAGATATEYSNAILDYLFGIDEEA
jgi:hypothetical protein